MKKSIVIGITFILFILTFTLNAQESYSGYRTLMHHACVDENGMMIGIESYCTPQPGYICYPNICPVIIIGNK